MGVTGLWPLLEPVGRRVNIETLAGKKVAIGEFFSFVFRLERGALSLAVLFVELYYAPQQHFMADRKPLVAGKKKIKRRGERDSKEKTNPAPRPRRRPPHCSPSLSLPPSSTQKKNTTQTPPSGSTSSSRRCAIREGSPCPTLICWASSGGRAGERVFVWIFDLLPRP